MYFAAIQAEKSRFAEKSKTIEQLAQKQAGKFGSSGFDRFREKVFAGELRKFAVNTIKILCRYSAGASCYILFDMGTIPEKY